MDPVSYLTNSVSVFFLFGALVGLCHLVLIKLLKLNKVAWKRMDYLWLGLAVLGLIGSPGEVRRWIATNYLSFSTVQCVSAFENVKNVPSYICQFWPENPDEKRQYQEACACYKKLQDSLPKKIEPDFPKLDFPEPMFRFSEAVIVRYIANVKDVYNFYNQRRDERQELVDQAERNMLESILFFLSPLLLAIGLAIRITKVTGELLLEKASGR